MPFIVIVLALVPVLLLAACGKPALFTLVFIRLNVTAAEWFI